MLVESAHSMHDKRTLDLLKDLAEKASAEKVCSIPEI